MPGLHGDEQGLIEKTRALARTQPVHTTCGDAKRSDVYHKCLYVECALSSELDAVRKESETIFERSEAYLPHVSLAYGLDPYAPLPFAIPERLTLTFSTLSLWRAIGLPQEWRRIATFPLRDPGKAPN
jgi:hypothetical protein